MARFEFSYNEVKIWHNEQTRCWFFMVGPELEVDPAARKLLGECRHVLTCRAADDWVSLISPPGPTPNRVVIITDGDQTIKRIFDASVPDPAFLL